MHFSARTSWDPEDNGFALSVSAARRSRTLLDLTLSNPTRCGLPFAAEASTLLDPLHDPRALRYSPSALGAPEAREAVAHYYLDHGTLISPEHLCLTTSTSEAYGFLFALLCDPGDEVLVATPGYPLLDLLAQLHDVRLREYPLFYDPSHQCNPSHLANSTPLPREASPHAQLLTHVLAQPPAWSIDLPSLRALITERTRALVLVHPNNPTGHYVSEAEREALEQLCAAHGLALIVDEVFLDYALPGAKPRTFVRTAGTARPASTSLRFVLSGISKICALPQMKLSWIAACGPEDLRTEALARLEIIADTFLSLNAPVQHALPTWLAARHDVQTRIRERLVSNLGSLDRRLHGSAASRLQLEGGWTAILRVPRHVDGIEFALACLERGVVVQPGSLYGLPAGRVVLSLLTPPEVWTEGLARLPI